MTNPGGICIVCEAHERNTALEVGHCCDPCQTAMTRRLTGLTTLAGTASTILTPRAGTGTGSAGYESKPPLSLDNAAPWLALIELTPGDPDSRVTITDSLTSWEVVIRSSRGLVSYGVATEQHSGDRVRGMLTGEIHLSARAFTGSIEFLLAQLDWITRDSDFPLVQFDAELRQCSATLRALHGDTPRRDRVVQCPTVHSDGTRCGRSITVRTWKALDNDPTTGEITHCRGCGAARTTTQLLHAGGGEDTWADAELIANHFGLSPRFIRKWAQSGDVARRNGLYRWADVQAIAHKARSSRRAQP